MHYTYVLFSERDGKLDTGTTSDLRARLKLHAAGRLPSTAHRRPLKLRYDAACLSADDASRRERYLKSGRGGRYVRTRLASSLARIRGNKLGTALAELSRHLGACPAVAPKFAEAREQLLRCGVAILERSF